jgi:outer membrane biosynthesis protein TonB
MRQSLLISAALHVVLFASLMLSAPRQFAPVREQVEEVEIVPEKDAPPAPEEKKDEPKPEQPAEKQSVWDFPPEKPKFDLPRFEPSEQNKPNTPMASQATTKAQPKPEQQSKSAPQKSAPPQSQPKPAEAQPQAAETQKPAPSPSASQQAALTPQGAAQPPASGFTNEPKPASSIFDPANIPKLMDLPNAQDNGFDAESTVRANLSNDERAAFKAHLRKCWRAPDGLAPATRVVLRISLRPNGALATEPMLIEASASRDGPAVMQAAMRALKDCQPYAFLPADKYKEWKVLDLSFTPRDMAGG